MFPQSCTRCPSATGMTELAAVGFTAGCFPLLGADLGTVGAASKTDHFPRYHDALVPSINDPLPQAQLHCIVLGFVPPGPCTTLHQSPQYLKVCPPVAHSCGPVQYNADASFFNEPVTHTPGWTKRGGGTHHSTKELRVKEPRLPATLGTVKRDLAGRAGFRCGGRPLWAALFWCSAIHGSVSQNVWEAGQMASISVRCVDPRGGGKLACAGGGSLEPLFRTPPPPSLAPVTGPSKRS